MRDLTVSADDIGLTKANTDTILEAADRGALTSASILVNGYAFQYAIEEWKKRRERLRLSVHLNLTEGKALLPHEEIPLLTTLEGDFKYSPASLWLAYLLSPRTDRAAFRQQVRRELSAQIGKARDALGYAGERIAVDGHMHVHMAPFVFAELMALADECKIGEVRIPDEPFFLASAPLSSYSLRHVIGVFVFAALAPSARRRAVRAGIRTNDAFAGALFSGTMTEETARGGLRAAALRLPARTEILFHPGSVAPGELDAWHGNTAWHFSGARSVERACLMSPEAALLFADFHSGALPPGTDYMKILRYLVSGTVAACVHLGSLYLFVRYGGLWYVAANVLAFCIALVVSFLLQKLWTFGDTSTERVHHQAFFYVLAQLSSLLVNTGGLYLLVRYTHIWYLFAEFLLLILVAIGNFFIFNLVIFRKHGDS